MSRSRMHLPDVRSVPPPPESAVASWYPGADLADAFAAALPGPGPHDLSGRARDALANLPPWVSAAMRLRDAAVRPFGLRTSGEIRTRLERGGRDRIGFFPVLSRSDREIVLGEDDRHLDFRVSLLLRLRADGGEDLVITAVVRCRNRLGRVYLAAILPGHNLIVRSILRRAAAP
ncbi:DUF2867 domain-containing protein [Methylobacterium oryzisoli]|uniref:DUF2867 domain-containing protein n=1 Tax=Methylobacterium oryzisoli TaxID=3385502 RepID=UPI003891E73F